ncbi:unnamed protein product [Ectocarpus sp. CCAP 1310/34]|nr:unnamed protein product [Ectocarpus sp. CCAP 1310/34]
MKEFQSVPMNTAEDSAKLKRNQAWVYSATFISYAMSHFSRKCYTNVKKQLVVNAGMSKSLLSRLDTGFMLSYAIGGFLSGMVGDRMRMSTVIAGGLAGSAVCVLLLAGGAADHLLQKTVIGANIFFMINWLAHGLFQSTGGPVGTAIMGNWFGKQNRGLVFGTWTCHQYVGNIIAALVATAVLSREGVSYYWALIIPAAANAIWGLVIYMFLPPHPEEIGLESPKDTEKREAGGDVNEGRTDGEETAISIVEAFTIPAVASYAIAFGFFKFTNYALFFWLPFFLTSHFSPSESNLISTLYDIGMMPGGIIVGVVSDAFGGRRACVIVTFLSLLCVLLVVFAEKSDDMAAGPLLVLLGLMGVLVGGPNNIISSAVAVDLAGHPKLAGTRSLGTVTGIINGSGSIVAAVGLLIIGPLQNFGGWKAVWYFLVASTIAGMALLAPLVHKEIFNHGHEEEEEEESKPLASNNAGYSAVESAP